MPSKILLVLPFVLLGSPALGQVSCGEQPRDIPVEVQRQIQGDVEGKARLFTKLFGDASLKGTVQSSKREVYEKHQNLDKSQIDRFMVWVSCQNIMSDPSLTTLQRQQLWRDVYRELSLGPRSGVEVPKGPHTIVTERLGLQFRQEGKVVPIRRPDEREFVVELRREAFEIILRDRTRRPSPDDEPALQVSISDRPELFALAKFGGKRENAPFFWPGTGVADGEHGSGGLFAIDNIAERPFPHNYLVGNRFNVDDAKYRGLYVSTISDGKRDLLQSAARLYMVFHLDVEPRPASASAPAVPIDPMNVDLVRIDFVN